MCCAPAASQLLTDCLRRHQAAPPAPASAPHTSARDVCAPHSSARAVSECCWGGRQLLQQVVVHRSQGCMLRCRRRGGAHAPLPCSQAMKWNCFSSTPSPPRRLSAAARRCPRSGAPSAQARVLWQPPPTARARRGPVPPSRSDGRRAAAASRHPAGAAQLRGPPSVGGGGK